MSVLEVIEPASDLDDAVKYATENAFMMGTLLAMKYHEQEELKAGRSTLNKALEKLADSTKDYNYTPQPSAMCYSIREPEKVALYFRCDGCGQSTSIQTYDDGGKEKQIMEKYRALASEFSIDIKIVQNY